MNVQGRLQRPTNQYNQKVLVGNWFEESCAYTRNKFNHISTYFHDYIPKTKEWSDENVIWDSILQNEGLPFVSEADNKTEPNFFKNFSSLYDLSYNHFPKMLKGPLRRMFRPEASIYEPRDEYLESYGNATQVCTGLRKYKKEVWRYGKSDPRLPVFSDYKDTFLPPKLEDYKFKRYATPLPNSSILDPSNVQGAHMKFRGSPICTVPAPDQLVVIQPEPRCNPITWECPAAAVKPRTC